MELLSTTMQYWSLPRLAMGMPWHCNLWLLYFFIILSLWFMKVTRCWVIDIQLFSINPTTSDNLPPPKFLEFIPCYPAQPDIITSLCWSLIVKIWVSCFHCCWLWSGYLYLSFCNTTKAPEAPGYLSLSFHICLSLPPLSFFSSHSILSSHWGIELTTPI